MNQPSPFQNDIPSAAYDDSFELAYETPITPSEKFYENRKRVESLLVRATELAPIATRVDEVQPLSPERNIDTFQFNELDAVKSIGVAGEFLTALRKRSAEIGNISNNEVTEPYLDDKIAA